MATLQFNDVENKKGLIQACERKLFNRAYGRISEDTNELKTFTTYLNEGKTWANDLIQKNDTRWEHDDVSYETLPNYTFDLIDDQTGYRLDPEQRTIRGASYRDADGNYQRLFPIDQEDLDQPLETVYATKGLPQYYDKVGDVIKLYPAPDEDDVTLNKGLKVYFQRAPKEYNFSDTNVKTGIPSDFDESIADYACWKYAEDNEMDTKAERQLRAVQIWEKKITDHFVVRDREDKPRMKTGRSRRLSKLR